MKDELGRKIMTKFVGLSAIYVIVDGSEDKKAKGTKIVSRKKLKF